MERTAIDPEQVRGWGVDADPDNDPTYPYKTRNNGEHAGYAWERPVQQSTRVEVLYSNERPSVSAVFGTSTPPSGLSGAIRRKAFRFSESSYGHWLPLMLADRINMVEGVLDDVGRGRIPNVFAERGWRVAWRHQKGRVIARVLVAGVLVTAAVLYARGRDARSRVVYVGPLNP